MRRMKAGVFKARCLSVMKNVQATGEPLLVTRRGVPLVKVVAAEPEKHDLFGFMADRVRIVGDIESSIPVKWETSEE